MTPKKPLIPALATAILLTAAQSVTAHGERTPHPATVAEVFIPMTAADLKRRPKYKHPPGNVRAEDMRELFGNRVLVINRGKKLSPIGTAHHAVKVIFLGRDGRYAWCAYDKNVEYFFSDHVWAPIKVKHDGMLLHQLDPSINHETGRGLGVLYDGATGQTIWYGRAGPRKTWVDWDVGHLQERLPRAVWTLCPDFPSAEELGVGVNEAQTAITYDKLIAQDPGRRILRPDLITPDPTEVIE